ncbi:hypothetical protein MAPG_04779 [Magnaporthiopsis poae ATCC 64411]|uniref:Uncharacterized protein n=1 Tax=Magnaporthiopsis poae (strain ATCC 64411 / 73-15) TaxID=644358 RepID=A0A0C4DXM5_MAGP6|nr:hypothetical protein MAPG_04779 [Magnaporthiopsis poae ATCC 64411]
MGLGTKIKNALHGDDRRSPKGSGEYEDGRLPGSFPSDVDPSAVKPIKPAQDPSLTGRTSADDLNTSPTLRKSQRHRHQKSDSGVDFGGAGEPGFDSRRQPGVAFAGDSQIEQPQPVKPANLGTNTKRDPYWGNINNNRGANNANDVPNNNGAGVDGYQKNLPLRPGSQGGPRDVYAKDFVGTNNGGMLNNGNTLSNLDGERDPYWSNGNAAGLDGNAYGVNNYGNDDMYTYSPAPGTNFSSSDHHHNNNGAAGVRNGPQAPRGIDNTHGVNGAGLNERNIINNSNNNNGDHFRDHDMGRSPGAGYGVGAGVSGTAASEVARKHHEADLREAGYHSGPGSSGSPTNAVRMNGNSVGNGNGMAAYGRSAGGSPPRMSQQQQPQQQQQQQTPSVTHFGPGAHNAARVLHTCTNCGVDNDISQYFRPDVAYRLGQ